MRSKPSPLFVWKLILIVSLAAALFMFLSDPMKIIFARRDVKLSDKLSQTHFKKGETGIIFFGDSLMNAVLPVRVENLNSVLEKEFRRQGDLKSRISAVELTSGGFWNLQDLSNQLLDVRPSVIVIQSEMVVSRNIKNKSRPVLTERVGTWSGVLVLKVFGQSQQRISKEVPNQFLATEKKTPKVKRRPGKNKEALDVARAIWSKQDVSTTDPLFMMARRFINRASAAGIRVVLVELPVSSTSAGFSSKEYFAKRTAALQTLSKWGAVTIVYPHMLPDDYFTDYNHVNHKGRREFLRWFLPVFSQEMINREPRR
jgi:hypothetical protein